MFGAQNKLSMDKDKYKKRLHELVIQLKEQEPDLFAYLQQEVNVSDVTMVSDSRIDKIEEYLGLDYKLDAILPSGTKYHDIDYSFITDDALRTQLESDFREMMRFRYGCRSHKADFDEFCRYAHLQLETLVNDCMEMWSLDNDDKVSIGIAKENIKNNWPPELELNLSQKATTVDGLDYFQKSTAILRFLKVETTAISRVPYNSICFPGHNIFVVNYLGEVINYIRKIRNDSSHRGVGNNRSIDDLIENYQRQKKIKNDSQYGYQYEFSKSDKEVKFYMWRKRQPWEDVISVILHIIQADKKIYDKMNN